MSSRALRQEMAGMDRRFASPRQLEVSADEAILQKAGRRLMPEPARPKSLPASLAAIAAFLFVIALSTLSGCVPSDNDGAVELLFADPGSHAEPGDRCTDAICTHLLERIQAAERSIDFAIYGARRQTQLLEALTAAQMRGVTVRGVVDADGKGDYVFAPTSTAHWVERLKDVRNDLETEQALDAEVRSKFGNRSMHNKFFVFDRRWVWTGSANVSDRGTGGYNANIVAMIASPRLAAVYTQEFEQMWSGRFHEQKTADGVERFKIGGVDTQVWFSPQDGALRRGVRTLITGARHSVDLAIFYLTDGPIVDDMIAAHRRGVAVRVLIDATAAASRYSDHKRLIKVGIPVKIENWGSKMHMKAAAIDGQTVVVGSMNWSYSGDKVNDENTLILRSSKLSALFVSFFSRLWDRIP